MPKSKLPQYGKASASLSPFPKPTPLPALSSRRTKSLKLRPGRQVDQQESSTK